MVIKKVGVVGMGTLGSQIGIVCARGGFQTIMVDLSKELIDKGLDSIKSFLNNQVKKGKMNRVEEGFTTIVKRIERIFSCHS
jgi:3-hydroxybutyryl-CoA dehydrogenase